LFIGNYPVRGTGLFVIWENLQVWGLLGLAGKDPRRTEAAVGVIDL
jgi:hypothetical protein